MIVPSASLGVVVMNYSFTRGNIANSIRICILYLGSISWPLAEFIRTRICAIREDLCPGLFRDSSITVKTDSDEAGQP
jgi:hypothetical protein